LREQAKKGGWDFKLLPVYFIAILDFHYDEKEEERKFRRDVCLKDQDGDVFFDKLHFKFLQMPLFNKQADELETHFDKWVYFLKNLESFDHIPQILKEPVFEKGFEIAELAHLKPSQYEIYQKSLLDYWEVKNVMDTSYGEGFVDGEEKGKIMGKIEVAIALKRQGQGIEMIMDVTALSRKEIESLK